MASFDPFATGNYTENNNWLYHSGELDHRGHYPYDVFDYYKDETRLIITLYLLDILIIIVYNKADYFAY